MLHALLHKKLDELIPEPQRREDALTSVVFGTLVLVNAWTTLARWLGVGYEQPTTVALEEHDCWFWPRLATAEPDAVLRLGSFLVVVEAKYRSGRNDLPSVEVGDDHPSDQLVRQYRSLKGPVNDRIRYTETLERAIRECRLIQTYVVDARRQRGARRECEESKARLGPEADLRIVTWQELFKLLDDPSLVKTRWARDLRSYLESCGLDTFEGIGHRLAEARKVTRLRQWAKQSSYVQWQLAWATIRKERITLVKKWRSLKKESASDRWIRRIDHRVIESAARTISCWRR